MGRRSAKPLCGKIGGGSNDYDADHGDASKSQWYNTCTSGGANAYPYGSTHDAQKCNGYGKGLGTTTDEGSQSECQSTASGYGGVYDLSGSVWEWEDACNNDGSAGDYCRLRGGSYLHYDPALLKCEYDGPGDLVFQRDFAYPDFGFRCCSE